MAEPQARPQRSRPPITAPVEEDPWPHIGLPSIHSPVWNEPYVPEDDLDDDDGDAQSSNPAFPGRGHRLTSRTRTRRTRSPPSEEMEEDDDDDSDTPTDRPDEMQADPDNEEGVLSQVAAAGTWAKQKLTDWFWGGPSESQPTDESQPESPEPTNAYPGAFAHIAPSAPITESSPAAEDDWVLLSSNRARARAIQQARENHQPQSYPQLEQQQRQRQPVPQGESDEDLARRMQHEELMNARRGVTDRRRVEEEDEIYAKRLQDQIAQEARREEEVGRRRERQRSHQRAQQAEPEEDDFPGMPPGFLPFLSPSPLAWSSRAGGPGPQALRISYGPGGWSVNTGRNDENFMTSNIFALMREVGRAQQQGIPVQNSGGDNMSYEDLLRLGERIGNADRGVSNTALEELPTRQFQQKPAPTTTTTQSAASSSTPSDQEVCSICLGEYEQGDTLRTLPCLHSYHQACIDTWLKAHTTCPVCKHSVTG